MVDTLAVAGASASNASNVDRWKAVQRALLTMDVQSMMVEILIARNHAKRQAYFKLSEG